MTRKIHEGEKNKMHFNNVKFTIFILSILLLLSCCTTEAVYPQSTVEETKRTGSAGLRGFHSDDEELSYPTSSQWKGIRVDPHSQHFVDETGRVVIFHG